MICNIAVTSKQVAHHVKRGQPNILDIHISMKNCGASTVDILEHLNKCNSFIKTAKQPQHKLEESLCKSTKPSKCIKLETNYRPKHFFDYLPPLPSVHTFKKTTVLCFSLLLDYFLTFCSQKSYHQLTKH